MVLKKKMMIGSLASILVMIPPVLMSSTLNTYKQDINSEAYNNIVMLRDWKLSNIAGTKDQEIFGKKLILEIKKYDSSIVDGKNVSKKDIVHPSTAVIGENPQIYIHDFMVAASNAVTLGDGRKQSTTGRNIILDIPAKPSATHADKVVLVGAHYDIMPRHADYKGQEGYYDAANDNRSGDADVLSIAKYFLKHRQNYSIRIAFWDWEEEGTLGSETYVKEVIQYDAGKKTSLNSKLYDGNIKFYLNLDSPAGGQFTYMGHGFDDKQSPNVSGGRNDDESFFKQFWDKNTRFDLRINPEYPEGSQGKHKFKMGDMPADISDESPFSKIGIPIVGMESTNYALVSKGGTKDGYAQTDGKIFWFPKNKLKQYSEWDLYKIYTSHKNEIQLTGAIKASISAAENIYNHSNKTRPNRREFSKTIKIYRQNLIEQFNKVNISLLPSAEQTNIGIIGGPYNVKGVNQNGYPRYMEEGNGYIWHTSLDTINNLDKVYPGKLNQQLYSIYKVITSTLDSYSFDALLK